MLSENNERNEKNYEFTTLIHIEGSVLSVEEKGVFKELIIKDSASGIELPVISYADNNEVSSKNTLMCVGTIHYNWKPDFRCPDAIYPVALKADVIKHK